ncbi:MAG: ATP-binding cassette domain-containing protein [Alphaproteobacteria bacterium]|nr:MAG: ATP-binding cassette domain-containing protein [Alphaproteobacteria bacterium]
MPDTPPAIVLDGIAKVYRLYDSPTEQALDVFGLSRLRFWRKPRYHDKAALEDISLVVTRGERLGIIGRNGAGKTTLLKLITGNFAPTRGTVVVNGTVQALINTGLGFHPEFTGYENIRAALVYNGLAEAELDAAIDDIVDFVELDQYLHQPIKTYSLGMQSRLYFATATAIRPDILIIDEVLGAGDAYFSAKSADRMKRLTSSGSTLLLVSHSMTQILQFCEEAVWIENGRLMRRVDEVRAAKARVTGELEFEGGVSQWQGAPGPRIIGFDVLDGDGRPTANLNTGDPVSFVVELGAEEPDVYPCYVCIVTHTLDGKWLTRHVSEKYQLDFVRYARRRVTLHYDRLLLGNGSYLVTVATYRVCDLQDLSTAVFYEILARSYRIQVRDEIPTDETLFHHSGTWSTGSIGTARGEPTAENSMMLDATERLGGTVR